MDIKKTCFQTNIPQVDETLKDCGDFLFSKCVSVDFESPVLNNSMNETLSDYLRLLDIKLNTLTEENSLLKVELESIKNQFSGTGFG